MSYDLFFKPRGDDLTREQFNSYFIRRAKYTLKDSQVWYENQSTGVHFQFDYLKPNGEEEHYPIAFNLNYARPSFFAKEAEPELIQLVTAFDMLVNDPQSDGLGPEEFNADRFVSGWEFGNEFGYRVCLSKNPEVLTLPSKTLEESWLWNYKKRFTAKGSHTFSVCTRHYANAL